MATAKMYECDTRRTFRKADGEQELRWVTRGVASVAEGDEIRCAHCHGEVRIRRPRAKDGPKAHAEHRSAEDARHCPGGGAVDPEVHRMSSNPVQ